MRVPLELSQANIDDTGLRPTRAELASWLRLVSVLSYDIGGREVLVVDLGTGESYFSPGEPAIWPPCGCRDFTRCLPVAAPSPRACAI